MLYAKGIREGRKQSYALCIHILITKQIFITIVVFISIDGHRVLASSTTHSIFY